MSVQEKLIELVRSEPVIYDTKHLDYMKKAVKDGIWDRIAKEINLKKGSEARNLWLKLRNCHRDALRRKMSRSASAAANVRPWKFEQQMQFLIRYMANRQADGSIACESEEAVQQDDDEIDDSLYSVEEMHVPIETDDEGNDLEAVEFPVKSILHRTLTSAASNDMSVRTLEQNQQRPLVREYRPTDNEDADEMFHFFMSMYKSVTKMPEISRLRVKRKIFNIVSEEEEALCDTPFI